jgi:hypothetical protein
MQKYENCALKLEIILSSFLAVRPPKRIVIDERERLALAQSLKVKAMDALKVCKCVICVRWLLKIFKAGI